MDSLIKTIFMTKVLIIIILFLSFPAIAQDSDYIINGGEVLRITVYNNPDLNTLVRVSQTGKITLPILGNIDLKGLTSHQVETKINSILLTKDILTPQANVFIEKFSDRYVTIIGEINNPGQYKLKTDKPTYLIDIISQSQGFTRDAQESVIILRNSNSEQKKITINLSTLLTTGDLSLNVALHDEDVIFVQRAPRFYIYGEVNRPGYYKIEPDLTVMQAISLAGGHTSKANTRDIRIVRENKKKITTIINVELNNPIYPDEVFFSDMARNVAIMGNDILYIPKSPYFYVYGEVNRPGFYKMEEGLTVIRALSIAGGTTEKASTNNVKISRKNGEKEETIQVNMNNLILGNDVIIVPESLF